MIPDESKILKNLKIGESSLVSSNQSSPTRPEPLNPLTAIPQLAQELLASFKVNSRVASVVKAFRFVKEDQKPTPKNNSPP